MRGFTLVELLLVIGILAILAAAAIVAINPFRQFALANNANRKSGIIEIMNAITQRMIDQKGRLNYDAPAFAVTNCPATGDDVPAALTIIGSAAGQYNLCNALVPTFIPVLPYDPQTGNYTSCTAAYNLGYRISCSATTGRITIDAPSAQLGETISITR